MRKKHRMKKAEPSRWDTSGAAHYPSFAHKHMMTLAAEGRGEIASFALEAAKLFRTEPEKVEVEPNVQVVSDVTRGIVSDPADAQRIQNLILDTNASFSQKTQTQRIFHARGRLVEVMKTSMQHIPADIRMEVVRRAMLFWKKQAQTDYGKAPTVRWKGEAMKKQPTKFVIPAQKALATPDLEKGVARGGKYYKRVPTGNPKRPWRYFYTKEQYERVHGGDNAHVDGFQVRKERALKELADKIKHAPDMVTENRVWPNSTDFGLPENTAAKHKKDGKYTKERLKLHEELVEKAVAGIPPVPKGQKPVAIVMMGGGGSGKGTIKKAIYGDKLSDFVNVDPDEMKEAIPEYQQALDLGKIGDRTVTAKNAAFMAHDESSDIAEKIRYRAMAERKNVVLDGTGKDAEKYAEKLKALKAQGYHVTLVYAHVDKDEAIKRAKERADRGGRFVPIHILEDAHKRIPGNFQFVADHADEAVVFQSKRPPTPLYTQPPPKPADDKAWKEFQALGKRYHEEMGIKLPKKEEVGMQKADKEKPSVDVDSVLDRVKRNGKRFADEDMKGPLPSGGDAGMPWPEPEYEAEIKRECFGKKAKKEPVKKSLILRPKKKIRLEW